MTARMSAARRDAFLRALEATGNQTLAAERARVSRSWVVKARGEDPEFDAAVRGAVAAAQGALARAAVEAGASAAPRGWGYLDGEELVVRGTGGSALAGAARHESGARRRVQVARASARDWTPRAEVRFLEVLGATCNVRAACAAVGLGQGSAYAHRRRWPAFARRWDETVETASDRLEWALLERGGNPLSGEEAAAPDNPIREMSASEAIYLIGMQRRRVREQTLGGGRCSEAELSESLLRKLGAVKRAGARGDLADED